MDMRSLHRALLLTTLLTSAACAPQQGGPVAADQPAPDRGHAKQPDPLTVTNAALGVYERVCLENPTRDAGRRAVLTRLGFREEPTATAAPFLHAGPGSVWLIPQPPPAEIPVAVVTRASGLQCQVMSPVAEPVAAVARFEATMRALSPAISGTWAVRKVGDRATLPNGSPGRTVSYLVSAPTAGGFGLAFVLTVRPSTPDGVALIATAAPARE
jgi:hypothetical protein